MAQLMGQGEHTVQVILIVEQDIGVDQRPGHIAAGPLSRVLIDIDPAAVQPLPEDGLILAPQGTWPDRRSPGRRHRGFWRPPRRPWERTHRRSAAPPGPEAFPQTDIAVHLVQVGPDGGDEIVIDLHRDMGAVQRGGQSAGIAPGGGEELKLLDLGVQGGGQGILTRRRRRW